jgi:hypothetical protein
MDKKQLSVVLNIKEKNVTDSILKYKYVEYPLNCCNDTPVENLLMFPGIDNRGYKGLSDKIKKHYSTYKTPYLKKLIDAHKKYNAKTDVWKQDDITDNFMRIYGHSRPDMKMMIVFGGDVPITSDMVYNKTFICSYCQVINIIYQAGSTFIKFFNDKSVYDFAEMSGISDCDINIPVTLYMSEESITRPVNIFNIVSPSFEVNGYWLDMLLNENSMRLTSIQKLATKYKYKHCRNIFMTYKNLMSKNFSALERDRTLIYSGTIFFSLGLRPCRDIDLYFHNKGDVDLLKKVDRIFNDEDKSKALDVSMEGHDEWTKDGIKHHWSQFILIDWPKMFGASHMDEVILDPKFHYYFLGCKFIKIEADLIRKANSMRPSHMGDILMVSTYPDMKIDVSVQPMPLFKKTLVSGVETSIDSRESLLKQLKLVKSAVNYKYNNKMTVEDLADLFPNGKILRDMLDGKVIKPPKTGGEYKKSSDKPKKSSDKPNKSSDKPKKSSDKPKKSSDKPNKSSDKPKKSSDKPKKSSDKPKKSSDKPKKSSNKPKKSSNKPKKKSSNKPK